MGISSSCRDEFSCATCSSISSDAGLYTYGCTARVWDCLSQSPQRTQRTTRAIVGSAALIKGHISHRAHRVRREGQGQFGVSCADEEQGQKLYFFRQDQQDWLDLRYLSFPDGKTNAPSPSANVYACVQLKFRVQTPIIKLFGHYEATYTRVKRMWFITFIRKVVKRINPENLLNPV